MLIRIEDKNELIDTNSLKLIANGADGKLYLYDNVLIKITIDLSIYMILIIVIKMRIQIVK